MHILQPCQDGWLSLLEQKRKISPGRCRSATLPVPHCDVTWGRGRSFQRPNLAHVIWHYLKWHFHIQLPFHLFSLLLSLPIITLTVSVCVCVHAHKHTCLIMSLLSHHCLMGFNSWCLEQMRAPVRASWCAWGHKDSASSIHPQSICPLLICLDASWICLFILVHNGHRCSLLFIKWFYCYSVKRHLQCLFFCWLPLQLFPLTQAAKIWQICKRNHTRLEWVILSLIETKASSPFGILKRSKRL